MRFGGVALPPVIVKLTGEEEKPELLAQTETGPGGALAAIENVALICVGLATITDGKLR